MSNQAKKRTGTLITVVCTFLLLGFVGGLFLIEEAKKQQAKNSKDIIEKINTVIELALKEERQKAIDAGVGRYNPTNMVFEYGTNIIERTGE